LPLLRITMKTSRRLLQGEIQMSVLLLMQSFVAADAGAAVSSSWLASDHPGT